MFKYIGSYFDVKDPEGSANLKKAMAAIFDFIKLPNNKDRGQGFVSLGKMSSLVEKNIYVTYLEGVIDLIKKEIKPCEIKMDRKGNAPTIKPNVDLESLSCIKYLIKNFGNEIDTKMNIFDLINDIFYSGYNNQVIQVMSEISKVCRNKYKRAVQIKLLNTINIILT